MLTLCVNLWMLQRRSRRSSADHANRGIDPLTVEPSLPDQDPVEEIDKLSARSTGCSPDRGGAPAARHARDARAGGERRGWRATFTTR
jgi:hypothetical protein